MMKTNNVKIHTSIDTSSLIRRDTSGSRSHAKAFLIGVTWIAIVMPLFAVVWNARLLPLLFPVGILIAYGCLVAAWSIQARRVLKDDGIVLAWEDRSHMILVQLVDDDGNALPPNIVQARLAEAEQQAGPNQIVIGVHHKLDSY